MIGHKRVVHVHFQPCPMLTLNLLLLQKDALIAARLLPMLLQCHPPAHWKHPRNSPTLGLLARQLPPGGVWGIGADKEADGGGVAG